MISGFKHHVRQTEAAADQAAVAEQFAHLFRRGVGGDVEVFRLFAEQQIAHPAADQISLVAGLVQAIKHFQRIFADVFTGDRVLFARDHGHRVVALGDRKRRTLARR